MKRACILILCMKILNSTFSLNNIPVFVLDGGLLDVQSQLDPLAEVSRSDFDQIMKKLDKLSKTMIFFIEDVLTLGDVTSKDEKGTAFPHSRVSFHQKKMKIFLNVDDPYSYIASRYPSYDFNVYHLKSTTSKLRIDESYKYMYIFFEDSGNETRVQKLRRHDALMQQVYFSAKHLSKGPAIGIYTGMLGFIEPEEQKDVTDGRRHDLPTEDHTIEFDCQNATFIFFNARLYKDHRLPASEAERCVLLRLEDDRWAYDLLFKFNDVDKYVRTRLQFVFKYINPNDRDEGWKATEMTYATDDGRELHSRRLDIQSEWSSWYSSVSPLVMESENRQYPSLYIDKYKFMLQNAQVTKNTTSKNDTAKGASTQPDKLSETLPKSQVDQEPREPGNKLELRARAEGKTGQQNQTDEKELHVEVPSPNKDNSSLRQEDKSNGDQGKTDGISYFKGEETSVDDKGPMFIEQIPNLPPGIQEPSFENPDLPYEEIPSQMDLIEPDSEIDEGGLWLRTSVMRQGPAPEILVTVPILMGLLVTFVMLIILFWGLSMIMSIETNSKYDSTDTKPLFDPDAVKD